MSALDTITDALTANGCKVTSSGRHLKAQCPAHEDRNPSLAITPIEGSVLLYCHAGCATEDVLAAVGKTKADLYDHPRENYQYDNGRIVTRKVATKGFTQKCTDNPPELYRLSRVRDGVAAGRTIFIVEGEKDVHAAEAKGVVATTSPQGAGKWSKIDPSPLYGAKKVVIVADDDAPGHKHAAEVVASLRDHVAELHVVTAKVGKDLADHIAAGYGSADLVPLELGASEEAEAVPTARVVTLADVVPKKIRWLWPGRLPRGKLVILDGDPSVGKSTLTTDFAARVSTGRPWPDGAACEAGDVLIMSAEDGLDDTIAPRLVAASADRLKVHSLLSVTVRNENGDPREVPPSLPRDLPIIRSIVREKNVSLVIIDVLMAYLNGAVDSHRDQDVRGVLHQLAAMAETSGCTIILIRHLNKTPGSNAMYRGGGSIGIIGAARAGFLVARDPEDEDRRILATTKINIAVEPPALAYRLQADGENDCARVEWEAVPVDYRASDLLGPPESSEDATESGEAADWLRHYLSERGGSEARKTIVKEAKAEGYSEKVLRRAREKAGVKTERQGFNALGSIGSVWKLPDPVHAHETPFMPTHLSGHEREIVGTNGTTPSGLLADLARGGDRCSNGYAAIQHPTLCQCSDLKETR